MDDTYTTDIFLSTRDGRSVYNYKDTWNINNQYYNDLRGFGISLVGMIFPNLVYPINEYNQMIYLTDSDGNPNPKTVTIPSANYTGATFGAAIKTALDAASLLTYTVSFDSPTEKLTISVVGPDTCEFTSGDNSAYEAMGFEDALFSSGTSSITSDNPIEISGTPYIQVLTNFVGNNYSSFTNSNVLTTVPVTESFGAWVFFSNRQTQNQYVTDARIHEIKMELRDAWGNPFKLPNNAYVQLTFRINSKER